MIDCKMAENTKGMLRKINIRYLGAPPDVANRSIECSLEEYIGEIKEKVQKELQFPMRLAIQCIFQQKVLPDTTTLAKVRFDPQKDIILVMGLQIAGIIGRNSG